MLNIYTNSENAHSRLVVPKHLWKKTTQASVQYKFFIISPILSLPSASQILQSDQTLKRKINV